MASSRPTRLDGKGGDTITGHEQLRGSPQWCPLHRVQMIAYNVRDSVLAHYTCPVGREVYVMDGVSLQPCVEPDKHRITGAT